MSIIKNNDICISSYDNKKYRIINLDNGIKALIINNDKIKNSYVSLDVNIGTFDEPKDYLGLAHFLEHVLFFI